EVDTHPLGELITGHQLPREDQPGDGPGKGSENHDDGRFDHERRSDLARLEAERPEDTDLLASLDHRPVGDNANGGDTDDHAKPHESLEDVHERLLLRLAVLHLLLDIDTLRAVWQQHTLDICRYFLRIRAVLEIDVIRHG